MRKNIHTQCMHKLNGAKFAYFLNLLLPRNRGGIEVFICAIAVKEIYERCNCNPLIVGWESNTKNRGTCEGS